MRFDKEKRVFMTKKFAQLKNATLVQRAWRTKYNGQRVPNRHTILNTVTRFEKTGSVAPLPPLPAGPSEKRESAKNELKMLISEDPTLSIRKTSVALGISYSLTRDILLNELKLKPYKYQEIHELQPQERVDFAEWFLELPLNTHDFLICSDEAHFYLTESVNKQNNRMWLESRPTDWIEKPLHDKKVLVWCAISSRKIYGPYYFEESVNQHNYLDMLKNFFWEKHYRTSDYKNYYFQQDGATPHTANSVQSWLTDLAPNLSIRTDGPHVPWTLIPAISFYGVI